MVQYCRARRRLVRTPQRTIAIGNNVNPSSSNLCVIGYSGMAYNIYGTWSNVTLKKDIEPLRSAVGFVKALQPCTYNMKDCKWEHEREAGITALSRRRSKKP